MIERLSGFVTTSKARQLVNDRKDQCRSFTSVDLVVPLDLSNLFAASVSTASRGEEELAKQTIQATRYSIGKSGIDYIPVINHIGKACTAIRAMQS